MTPQKPYTDAQDDPVMMGGIGLSILPAVAYGVFIVCGVALLADAVQYSGSLTIAFVAGLCIAFGIAGLAGLAGWNHPNTEGGR